MPCLRRNRKSAAGPGRRKTTASAPIPPFLVAPKDSTSTPATASARPTPSPAAAFASRAPSRCTARPRECAQSASSRTSSSEYRVPSSVDCVIDSAVACTWCSSPTPRTSRSAAAAVIFPSTVDASEQLGAEVPLGCAALVGVDVRAVGADHRLVRPDQRLQCEHVRRGAVEDQEGLRVRSEVDPEQLLGPGGPLVRPVRDRVAVVRREDGVQDRRVHRRVVVAAEGRHPSAPGQSAKDSPVMRSYAST